jgi:type II secretory pathway pseudopilin PulG
MTLIELMISIGVVLVGLLGLFKVLSSAVGGSAAAQRMTQGRARAQLVMENVKSMPIAVVNCLAAQPPSGWTNCEALCKSTLGASALPEACIFTTLSAARDSTDSSNQAYAVVVDTANLARSSWVVSAGPSGHLFDVQITVGWNDDGTAAAPWQHRVTVKSAVFP